MSKENERHIEHLIRRAGFGGTPPEMKRFKSMGYQKTLKEFLHPEKVDNDHLKDEVASQDFDYTRIDDLRRWWIYRMTYTRCPLEEKMTLFWHGHFATSNRKVNSPYGMYMQNVLFRTHGMGNFEELLLAVSKDPAMISWLDNQQNKKGKPNENYAREIMELFCLGIGNYTEQDIKEAARSFTGYQMRRRAFFFNEKDHDANPKTIFGETGNFNGDDVVALLVRRPACAKFLATKMCKFFVSDDPSETIVADVAASYTADGNNIRAMLHTLFTHDEFLSANVFHTKIKSPTELVVGTLKNLQVTQLDSDLPNLIARMGQNLFEPPSVKGWDGGKTWIATDTMMQRFNFAARITQQKFDALEGYIQPAALVQQQQLSDPDKMVEYFAELLVDGDVSDKARLELKNYLITDSTGKHLDLNDPNSNDKLLDSKLRGLVHLFMTLPTYQLA